MSCQCVPVSSILALVAARTRANLPPLAVQVVRFPDPSVGPYVVRMWFEEIVGRTELVGVELWGRLPWVPLPELAEQWAAEQTEAVCGPGPLDEISTPISAVAIRDVPFMSLAGEARARMAADFFERSTSEGPLDALAARLNLEFGDDESIGIQEHIQSVLQMAESERQRLQSLAASLQGTVARGRGRPTLHGPDFYARVALIYTAAVRAGLPNPTLTVANHISADEGRAVSKTAAAKWVAICRRTDASGNPVDPGHPHALLPPWDPTTRRSAK